MQIHISRDDNIRGPFTREQVQYWLEKGTLLPDDLAYHEGLEGWIPLSELMDSVAVPVASSPPLVPPPQPGPVTESSARFHNLPWSQSKLGKIHSRCRRITGGFGFVFWIFIVFFGLFAIFAIGSTKYAGSFERARHQSQWWTYFEDLALIAFFIWILLLMWVWWGEKREKDVIPELLKEPCCCGSGNIAEDCCYVGVPKYACFGWKKISIGGLVGGGLMFFLFLFLFMISDFAQDIQWHLAPIMLLGSLELWRIRRARKSRG